MKRLISLLIVLVFTIGQTIAQPPPPPPPNVAISIDIVVGLLILAGIFFGARKLFKKPSVQEPKGA